MGRRIRHSFLKVLRFAPLLRSIDHPAATSRPVQFGEPGLCLLIPYNEPAAAGYAGSGRRLLRQLYAA